MRRDSKRLVARRRNIYIYIYIYIYKGRHPPASLRLMGSELQAETGFRKVYDGKVFDCQTNSIAAKETFGDDGGTNFTNSQLFNQYRQDAISRVLAVQNSANRPR